MSATTSANLTSNQQSSQRRADTDDFTSSLSSLFASLANDDRLAILHVLRSATKTDLSIEEVAVAAGLSRFATSRHLAILRAAGLVSADKRGHKHLQRLCSFQLTVIDDWLVDYLYPPSTS